MSARQRWSQTTFSELAGSDLKAIESLDNQKVIDSIVISTDSRADPIDAIPQLVFLRHSANVHGLNVYSLIARNESDPYADHYDDADAYQGLKDFDYLAVWKAPSGKTHVILMKDNVGTLAAFSKLASRLSAIEPESIEPTKP
ncbi:hypothetical protein [Phytohalomonas tamaricis]|uniref:hypothetical protein n=1 Tax=Phytohalomonas tamaricis TaxID=2081032 RepID=UPI000D0AD066|nr:hypothetical protein [Phytohalomonas tamaricis]